MQTEPLLPNDQIAKASDFRHRADSSLQRMESGAFFSRRVLETGEQPERTQP